METAGDGSLTSASLQETHYLDCLDWTARHQGGYQCILVEDISVYFLSVDLRFCLNHVPNQYVKILLLSVIALSVEDHRMLPPVGGVQD